MAIGAGYEVPHRAATSGLPFYWSSSQSNVSQSLGSKTVYRPIFVSWFSLSFSLP